MSEERELLRSADTALEAMGGRVEELEAALDSMREERDVSLRRFPELIEAYNHWKSRAVAAEAELARLREALRIYKGARGRPMTAEEHDKLDALAPPDTAEER